VHLWLTNEKGSYDQCMDAAREALETEYPRAALADEMRAWFENVALAVYVDEVLLGWAVQSVDWFEVADAFLEDAREMVSA
jgi:hypothetical protein